MNNTLIRVYFLDLKCSSKADEPLEPLVSLSGRRNPGKRERRKKKKNCLNDRRFARTTFAKNEMSWSQPSEMMDNFKNVYVLKCGLTHVGDVKFQKEKK